MYPELGFLEFISINQRVTLKRFQGYSKME